MLADYAGDRPLAVKAFIHKLTLLRVAINGLGPAQAGAGSRFSQPSCELTSPQRQRLWLVGCDANQRLRTSVRLAEAEADRRATPVCASLSTWSAFSSTLDIPKVLPSLERGISVALLMDELADQVLEQTRVVSNGPVLAPQEALHVEVIPGGGAGAQPTNDALSLALGAVNPLAALHIDVTYELQRDGVKLKESTITAPPDAQYVKVPTVTKTTSPAAQGLLSVAFLVAPPKIRLVKAGTPPSIPAGLPSLDHKLLITITVTSPQLQASHSRTIELPSTVTVVDVPLPIPPAVCICASDLALGGEKYLIMVPPGAPSAVPEIVQTYNSVLDGRAWRPDLRAGRGASAPSRGGAR